MLATFHPSLSESALRSLRGKRVDVRLRALVKDVRPGEIELTDGHRLLNWAYDYFFYDRPVRLMVRAEEPRED